MAFGDLLGSGSNQSSSPGTSLAVATGFTVAVGDLVYVAMGMRGSPTTPLCADGLSNNYFQLQSGQVAANVAHLEIWYSIITNAGTAVPTISFASTSNDAAIVAGRYEGPWAVSPVDVNAALISDVASPFDCPSTGILAQVDEFIFGVGACRNGLNGFSGTAPLVNVLQINSGTGANTAGVILGSYVVASTISTSPQFTNAGNPGGATWSTTSFKKGAVVGGGTLMGSSQVIFV